MDMEKWVSDWTTGADKGGRDYILVEDLLELLKTHTIVPNEATEAMIEVARDYESVGMDVIDTYKAMLKAAQENS